VSEHNKTQLDGAQFRALVLVWKDNIEAINRLSDNTGKWLALIAQALGGSDPDLQKKIDALTEDLHSSTDELKDAVDAQK
jgi:hypothetical protein